MAKVAQKVRFKRRGITEGFDLIIDGQPFTPPLARSRIEVEMVADNPPLYVIRIPLFAETIEGLEDFNDTMDREAQNASPSEDEEGDIGTVCCCGLELIPKGSTGVIVPGTRVLGQVHHKMDVCEYTG